MKIGIFGTGYVGLVAAACFADKGHNVDCIDIDQKKIDSLNQGIMPIFEKGLAELVADNKERLRFTTDAKQGVLGNEVIFLAVGTPQKKDGQGADTQYLEAAAVTIAKLMEGPKIIVIKSTVPVGTSKIIHDTMAQHTKHKISLVSNPEFLKEGDAIRDFDYPDRVIIGTSDEHARAIMHDLYQPFVRKNDKLIEMDNPSAELTKYASNIMLAARITVMNELSRLAEATGANIMEVRHGVGADSRVGSAFLFPGPGYGGSCFPKDVRETVDLSRQLNVPLALIPAIDAANEAQKMHFSRRVLSAIAPAKGKQVAVWGAAFKAQTDDIRESAALIVIQQLLDAGVAVSLYDPEALDNVKRVLGSKVTYGTQYDVLEGADALVIMTDWNEFKNPDFDAVKASLKHPVIVDSRNLYDPERMRTRGFSYTSIGRQ